MEKRGFGTFGSSFPLTLPRFWFRKGSTQGSYFKAISGVFPYPNGFCKKIKFHIELQIYAIGMGWLLLAPPLRTARASSPAYGSSGGGLSFALRCSQASTARRFWPPYSVTRDPSQHRQRSLDSSRPGRLGSKLPLAYLTPFPLLIIRYPKLLLGEPSLFGSSSAQCGTPVFWFPLGLPCSQVDPMAARKGDLVLYSGDLFPTEARKLPSCPRSHSVNRKGKPTHLSAPLVDRCGFTKRLSTVHSR